MQKPKSNFLKLLVLACSLQLSAKSFSQDIHFSQFFEAPLYRNPALAGIAYGDVRMQTVYRSQWNSVGNAYKTGSVNAEYKLPVVNDDYVTLGMQVLYDRAGSTSLSTTQILPALNYHKSLSQDRNMYLSVGFMGGLVQRNIDRSKMTTSSTYAGMGDGETNLIPQYKYFDGSAGISFNAQMGENPENNIVLGAAYHHFNRPKSSFFNNQGIVVSAKWVFSADVKTAINDYTYVTIHNDFIKQGSYSEMMSGILYGIKFGPYTEEPDYLLSAGIFMRWKDALIPTIQLDYKPFTVSVSYDVNISPLAQFTHGRGGYELSLKYIGFLDRDNSSANAVRCPRF